MHFNWTIQTQQQHTTAVNHNIDLFTQSFFQSKQKFLENPDGQLALVDFQLLVQVFLQLQYDLCWFVGLKPQPQAQALNHHHSPQTSALKRSQ